MCGIYSWAGKNIKDFNRDKFTILGLYNIERGKDSCGVSFDGEIYQGFGTNKLFSTFIRQNTIDVEKYPVVIGHTRQASYGSVVSSENVHPFGFGSHNNGFEFIGCHNGTLYNENELAKKYHVETIEKTEKKYPNHIATNTRTKIDSEILLEIIYKNKNFNVLSEYNGGAALVFTNTKQPNVIYVWKGASREFNYHHSVVKEERPLFYYVENNNSLYISSLYESLEAIGGTKNIDVFTFEENTVYEITDGNIENAVKHKINRDNSLQKKEIVTHSNYVTSNYYNRAHTYEDIYDEYYNTKPAIVLPNTNSLSKREIIKSKKELKKLDKIVIPNIHNESTYLNQNDYKGKSYFNKLRFWKNGHLLSGIYTWIEGYGYYFLAKEDNKQALKTLKDLVNLPFIDNGFCYLYKNNLNLKNPKIQSAIPFKDFDKVYQNMHYFVQGVKIETFLDFQMLNILYEKDIEKKLNIDLSSLSETSCHPVISLTYFRSSENQEILHKNELYTGNFTILGAEKVYHIEKGNLTKLFINDFQKNLLHESKSLIKTEDELILENQKTLFDQVEEDNDRIANQINHFIDTYVDTDVDILVSELIEKYNEEMIEFYSNVDDLIKELEDYNIDDDKIKKAISTLTIMKDYLSNEL